MSNAGVCRGLRLAQFSHPTRNRSWRIIMETVFVQPFTAKKLPISVRRHSLTPTRAGKAMMRLVRLRSMKGKRSARDLRVKKMQHCRNAVCLLCGCGRWRCNGAGRGTRAQKRRYADSLDDSVAGRAADCARWFCFAPEQRRKLPRDAALAGLVGCAGAALNQRRAHEKHHRFAPFLARMFISSAKNFGLSLVHTLSVSHPEENGVVTFGTRT